MCTLTVVPICRPAGPGFAPCALRLVCNRDEKRDRAPALAPVHRRSGAVESIMPLDPVSGGTWIAANSAGLVLCLLNAMPAARCSASAFGERSSRGRIIPFLLDRSSVREVLALRGGIDPCAYPPFRLLACDEGEMAILDSDGESLRFRGSVRPLRPFVLTSSGLGDALVGPPRRALFRSMLGTPAAWPEAQRRFHEHSWPDRPELSVLMQRADARTVSRTVVELGSESIRMEYSPLNEDGRPAHAAPAIGLRLRRESFSP